MDKGTWQSIIVDFSVEDYKALNRFAIEIIELIKKGYRSIIINFTDEIEFNSKDLKTLHRLLRIARFKFRDIKIVVPSKKMKDTFILTRLGVYSRIHTSLEEAKCEGIFLPLIKYGTILAAAVFVLTYANIIKWLIFSWIMDPYYSHGFLAVGIGLILIWLRRKKIKYPQLFLCPRSCFFICLAIGLYLLGHFQAINFFIGLSAIFFILGSSLLLHGKKIYKQIFLPVALLFFALPLPRIEEAASILQHFTAFWAASLVSVLGTPAYSHGIEIIFNNLCISIDAPCSGLRSLIALLFIATLFIGLLKAPFYKKGLLFLTIVPISLLANLLRITVLILIASRFGLKIAMIYFHYFSGVLFFIAAISILSLEKTLLKCDWDIT